MNPDSYYSRTEVSNSDLTRLKELLHPIPGRPDPTQAFRFGSLVDAIITEPERVNRHRLTVDDEAYTPEEFGLALEMQRALWSEARRDPLLAHVLANAETQHVSINPAQRFTYGHFSFTLPTRCKWDWRLPSLRMGGDLKTTSAATQAEFDEAIDRFDWDRSRAWYMDIDGTSRDFIYAISKKNCAVFKPHLHPRTRKIRAPRLSVLDAHDLIRPHMTTTSTARPPPGKPMRPFVESKYQED